MFITQQIIKVAMGNVQHCANLTVQQDEYLNTVIIYIIENRSLSQVHFKRLQLEKKFSRCT